MSESLPSSVRSGRIIALDGLRAIAVVLVIAGHGVDAYAPDQASALWLAPFVNASLGVRLFFVLSGLLITSLLWHEHQRRGSIDWRAFVLRRSLRIWPALYTYLLVMLVLTYAGVLAISSEQFLAAATFTWNYASIWIQPGTSQGSWFLGHLWTLALEVQFYAVAGVIEPWARPAQRQALSPWLYGVGVAAFSALAVLIPQPALVFRVLPVFGLGWVTAHRALRPQPVHGLAIAWLLLLLFRVAGFEQALVAAVCVVLLKLTLLFPSFGPKLLLWLGGISYSLFLIHVPIGGRVVNLFSRFTLSGSQQLLVCLLSLSLSLLAAWVFCVLIERPSHRVSRNLLLPG